MEIKEEPEFFIASKLRGIPLVTEQVNSIKQEASKSKKNKPQLDIHNNNNYVNRNRNQHSGTSVRPKRQPEQLSQEKRQINAKMMSGRQISVSINGKPLGSGVNNMQMFPTTRHPHESNERQQTLREMVMKDLEKRQVDQPVSLLFKPSASTASVRNRKSGTNPTTTTTRKPKIISTTRKMPLQQTRQQNTPRLQISTTSSTTTSTTSTTTKTPTTTTLPSTTTTTTTTTTTKKPITITPNIVRNNQLREDRLASIFSQKDEHVGPLTTRQAPDYQQRTHQSLGASQRGHLNSRYRDEPNAGKNWILFNRQDGSFSAFELAVLISNVAIVGTIIFVILFTWIKAFNSKFKLSNLIYLSYTFQLRINKIILFFLIQLQNHQ